MTEKPTPVDDTSQNVPDADELVAKEPVDLGEEITAGGPSPAQPEEQPDDADLAEPEPEELDPAVMHALGALALGIGPSADDPDIRSAVAASPALQRELAPLLPIADILTSLYQAQSAPPPAAAVVSDGTALTERGRAVPERRARAAARREERPAAVRAAERQRSIAGVAPSTAVSIGLAVIAAIAVLWALAQMDRVTARDEEIAALREQLAQVRQAANASAFVLSPASEEAPEARGTIFYSIADRTVLLDVSGLPALDDDEAVYQVWFQRAGSNAWELGPAFQVSREGDAVLRLAGDTPGFTQVAISQEPAPGSPEPSGQFLLEGALAGANG